ncbi:MAG TPA: hypothetical protein EYN96_07255 [Candidatus Hydrogenedentes bacterium]|jgi:uncharacterized protein YndB with AHSA1/START domain|nr:hypothetical protein [Candidatus Hydrogenedentota bacterium]
MFTKLTVEIDATPETVFRWVVDPERVVLWLNHLSKFEILNDSEPKVGAKFRQAWDDEGDNSEILGSITKYIQDERYCIHLDGKGFQVDVEYRFKDIDGRTRLTQKTNFDYKGIMKMIEKVVGGKIRRSYEDEAKRNLAKLIDLCEAEAQA